MGVDLGGELVLGCDLSKCRHLETKRLLRDILMEHLSEDEQEDEDSIWSLGGKAQELFDLQLFRAYDNYSNNDRLEPTFIGVGLCRCGNRGEPIADACSREKLDEATTKLQQVFREKGLEGEIVLAFMLEAS